MKDNSRGTDNWLSMLDVTPFSDYDKNNSQRLSVHSSLHASLPLVLSHGLSCIPHGLLIKRIQIYSNAFRLLSLRFRQRRAILRKGRVCSMALSGSHALVVRSIVRPLSLSCGKSFLILDRRSTSKFPLLLSSIE